MLAFAPLAALLLLVADGFRVGLADPPVLKPPSSAPVIPGLPYQEFIQKNLLLVAASKIDEAIDHLETLARKKGAGEELRQEWKKLFPRFLELAGPCTDREVVGLRQMSSRLCTVYALASFEHKTLLFTYAFEKVGTEWKLNNVSFSTELDALEKLVPFQPIRRE